MSFIKIYLTSSFLQFNSFLLFLSSSYHIIFNSFPHLLLHLSNLFFLLSICPLFPSIYLPFFFLLSVLLFPSICPSFPFLYVFYFYLSFFSFPLCLFLLSLLLFLLSVLLFLFSTSFPSICPSFPFLCPSFPFLYVFSFSLRLFLLSVLLFLFSTSFPSIYLSFTAQERLSCWSSSLLSLRCQPLEINVPLLLDISRKQQP